MNRQPPPTPRPPAGHLASAALYCVRPNAAIRALWTIGSGLLIAAVLFAPRDVAAQAVTVAVAPFENRTGKPDRDALSKGLADMLITDLSVSKELRLVERERLQALIAEMKLGKSGLVDRKTAQKMGKLLGADALLMGTMTALAPTLRLDARLVAVGTGEVMATAKAEGPLDAFFQVEATLAKQLLTSVGASLSPLQKMRIGKATTRNLTALRAYSRGLDATDRGDKKAAKQAFSQALEADAGFAKAKEQLAALQTRVTALEKRTAAVERAGGLILKPKTAVEHWSNASVYRSRGDTEKAATSLKAALQLKPAAVDLLLALAELRKPSRPAWPKRVPKKLATAAEGIASGDFSRAFQATRDALGKRARPAELRAAILLRLVVLRPPFNGKPTAPERHEEAALLAKQAEVAADDFASPEVAKQHGDAIASRRAHYDAKVPTIGPILWAKRGTLVQTPVRVTLRPFGGRWKPPFMLRLVVAEPGASDAKVRIGSGEALELPRLTDQPVADELSVFEAPSPRPWPKRDAAITVIYTNRRNGVVTLKPGAATFQPALLGRDEGYRHAPALGEVAVGKYPNLLFRAVPTSPEDEGGQVLVNAAAGVWSTGGDAKRLVVAPLLAGRTTAFATGQAVLWDGNEPGAHFIGLQGGWQYRVGTGKAARVLAGRGTWGVQRVGAKRAWLSVAQSNGLESGFPFAEPPAVTASATASTTSSRARAREVTVDEYRECVRAGVCQPLLGASCASQQGSWWGNDFSGDQATGCLPVAPNPYPVTGVLKRQAQAYCRWIGGALPTWKQWRKVAEAAAPSGDNFLDAVSCAWMKFGRKPRECDEKALQQQNKWDGHGWIAPAGIGSEHVLGNVREWLEDEGGWAAGCSYDEPMGAPCKERRKLGVALAHDVGFRCLGGKSGRRMSGKVKTSRPSLDWVKVPAGEVVLGGSKVAPVVLTYADGKRSSGDIDALRKALIGVPGGAAADLLALFEVAQSPIEVDAHAVQELFSRGRWAGLNAAALVAFTKDYRDGKVDKKRLKATFDIYVTEKYALERWRRKHKSGLANNEAMSDADKQTARLVKLVDELRRQHRAPEAEKRPKFWDDRGFSCALEPSTACSDPTGLSGTRLRLDRHRHRPVTIDAFAMLKTEVTQAQFQAAMGYVPSYRACSDCPVARVTWEEAAAFCKKVGGRLPTEGQWERAAAADAPGGIPDDFDDHVAWRANSPKLPKSGDKDDNGLGLHDLVGGVWEWTADAWEEGGDFERLARYVKVTTPDNPRPYRAASIADLEAGRATAPEGKACLYMATSYARVEANLQRLPWKEEKRYQRACYSDAKAALDALKKAMRDNPQGPVVDPKRSKPAKRVLKGGSWGSDERHLTTHGRIGYRQHLRHDFVGFRCVK